MSKSTEQAILEELIKGLDVPDSAYETAIRRYEDLGSWLQDPSNAESAKYGPAVSGQGSFRLGTTVQPWKREDFDLDMTCKLTDGLNTGNVSQAELKELLGRDLEKYRAQHSIEDKLEEKHRCWRLNYRDDLSFHMDSVPCITADDGTRRAVETRMLTAGRSTELVGAVVEHAVLITDNRRSSYRARSSDWLISNPEGYALWFESRMRLAGAYLEKRASVEVVASIDDLPAYRWKTPLQRSVQILKRHRDIQFEKDSDSKPASIIITTLAAQAYDGESDVDSALKKILDRMGDFVNKSKPRVPNPVNPAEDFGDRWYTPEGIRLGLKDKFWAWLEQARADYANLTGSRDTDYIMTKSADQYGSRVSKDALRGIIGESAVSVTPVVHSIREGSPKPWHRS